MLYRCDIDVIYVVFFKGLLNRGVGDVHCLVERCLLVLHVVDGVKYNSHANRRGIDYTDRALTEYRIQNRRI